METSWVQLLKLQIVGAVGLSKDALHIHVGLAVFVVACWVLRKTPRPALAFAAVFAVACLGELLDLRDDLRTFGVWRWPASVHDIVNTCWWPLVLAGLHAVHLRRSGLCE
ncbi:hypothetical protein CCO03_16265 [Comamonas serinivorans]|uniref:Uncharacterized protein n=1 Tax=Comamonas serinivorans TaxID=1082851 RepID=A0A1Y0EQS8_9BURK|nr:hypothetical protein [Comamonas serinivorans]ARU06014.1 hypothetical protein CCO03_16265 [Comamonas serinivorans]